VGPVPLVRYLNKSHREIGFRLNRGLFIFLQILQVNSLNQKYKTKILKKCSLGQIWQFWANPALAGPSRVGAMGEKMSGCADRPGPLSVVAVAEPVWGYQGRPIKSESMALGYLLPSPGQMGRKP
jgi:hypothetical protein